jgi:hypothetical protein
MLCLRCKYICVQKLYLLNSSLISGVPRYRFLTPALAYSICMYVAVGVSVFFNVRHHLRLLFKEDNDFRDSIYTCMFITMLANCTCVPVLAWLDTPTVIQYFKEWEHFQVGRASNFLKSDKKITLLIFVVRFSNLETKM